MTSHHVRTILATLVALWLAAAPTQAQAPRPADFDLRPSASLQPRVDALAGKLRTSGVDAVLAAANRPATANGACRASAFPGIPSGSSWFCFDKQDTGSTARPDAVEWIPQGITPTPRGSRTTRSSAARRAASTPAASPGYGNRLYVADTTRGVRVFDMRFIFDLASSPNGDTSSQTQIGRHGSKYGFGYRYVLPQVGAWVNAAGADNDGDFTCAANGAPKFSSVAVDRAASPHRLVTSEYLSRSRGSSTAGQLLLAAAAGGSLNVTATRTAGIGPEDLSYVPDRVWTVTEHAGRRMLYGVPR